MSEGGGQGQPQNPQQGQAPQQGQGNSGQTAGPSRNVQRGGQIRQGFQSGDGDRAAARDGPQFQRREEGPQRFNRGGARGGPPRGGRQFQRREDGPQRFNRGGARGGPQRGGFQRSARQEGSDFRPASRQSTDSDAEAQAPVELGPPMEKVEVEPAVGGSAISCFSMTQKIEANYLKVSFDGLPDNVIHYDIVIEPDRPKKFFRPAFANFIHAHFPTHQNGVAYDGMSSFYAMARLIDENTEVEHKVTVVPAEGGRPKEFKIKIKEATTVNMQVVKRFPQPVPGNLMQAIQCLDIVLRTAFDKPNMVRHKRTVFSPPPNPINLPDNYQLWIGLFQSFVLGTNPYLNVDVTHKAFPAPIALDQLYEQCKYDARQLYALLKGLMLVYKSPFNSGTPTTYKFNKVKGAADKEKFTDKTNGK